MYVISSLKDGKFNGQIANTVFQITSEPATIAISINRKNLTHEFIEASGRFTVSALEEGAPLAFIGKFGFKSGKTEDKFKDTCVKMLRSGCPVVLDYAVSYLEAKVIKKLDCGTHTLFIGELGDSEVLMDAKPMTYDYYHNVKKGTTPPKAPTFIRQEMRPTG
jgi:ferric-chelate reductase [NAD(P)H]